ncbi:MAG: cytochrome c [Myxococcales bacterium]|nr:cytochrome c [Myxococcales bacterium]
MRLVVAMSLALSACTANGPRTDQTETTSTRTIPTQPANPWLGAAEALEQHCTSCHAEGRIAEGWPLTQHEDAHRLRHAIRSAVGSGAMPPWPADPADVAYRDDRTLDADTLAVLEAWLDADAPAWGDPPRALSAPPPATLPRVDLTLRPDAPYTPTGTTDDRRCFRLSLPADAPSWITGTRLLPGNPGVHHVIVVQAQADTDLVAMENEDAEPGWDCRNRLRGGANTRRLTGWVPGQDVPVVPPGAGFRRAPGADLVMVVHYWLPAMTGPTDLTSLELMVHETDDIVPVEYLLIRDRGWRPGAGMALEKGELLAEHRAAFAFDDLAAELVTVDGSAGLTVHTVLPHMHEHGSATSVDLAGPEASTTLLTIGHWDVDWQLEYALEEPLSLLPTDTVDFGCTYEGSGEPVAFGRSTEEEMCSLRLLVTARAL